MITLQDYAENFNFTAQSLGIWEKRFKSSGFAKIILDTRRKPLSNTCNCLKYLFPKRERRGNKMLKGGV